MPQKPLDPEKMTLEFRGFVSLFDADTSEYTRLDEIALMLKFQLSVLFEHAKPLAR